MNGSQVVNSTADAAFAVNGEGKITAWNRAATKRFGHRRKEILSRNCWEVMRGRDLFSNQYCCRGCPLKEMVLRGEPARRTQAYFSTVTGEMVRFEMSILMFSGKNPRDKEIVHLLNAAACPAPITDEVLPAATVNNKNARLSIRQLEVLGHLATGMGTGELGEVLCISPATVRHHIQGILRGLRVHTRLEAVVLGRRIGLI